MFSIITPLIEELLNRLEQKCFKFLICKRENQNQINGATKSQNRTNNVA